MSAEGPVRKPPHVLEGEPPDVDSLMSRLDGQADGDGQRTSDPGPASGRPSAAELLGGRGRRTKRTIRVPDDAVPAGAPSRRTTASVPPPPAPEPKRPSVPPPVIASEPQPVRIMPQRIISVGGLASSPPPAPQPIVERPAVAIAEPTPIGPPVIALPNTAPLAPPISVPAPASPMGPTSDVRLTAAVPNSTDAISSEMPATPPAAPQAIGTPLQAPTLPNLDAQVREALALLDRDDFEGGIDVQVDPNAEGPASEEPIDEIEVVKVEMPQPSKKVHSAPHPPPKRTTTAQQRAISEPPAATLPSAAATAPISITNAEPTSQPAIVVAAAATAQSSAHGPAIAAASPPAAVSAAAPTMADATGELRKKKRQWFEELFNDDYGRTLPKLKEKYLEREVKFIEDALGCDKGATILDLGCGPGEQAVALAARGYEVIGIDLSLAMLARAADEAAEKNQRINFLQGDMRDLTFDEAFDGIYCWGTTFGYFDDAKNMEVVQKIHKALRRGGRFLLDIYNRDYVVPRTPSMVWFEGEGCVCMDEVHHNAITSRLQVKRTMMMEDGRQREIDYSIRLYALHELGKLLHECGFRVAEASGDTST
ncbi:MAG: methyltransferase domain-containing protein, partial [Polyangiales bacterium]